MQVMESREMETTAFLTFTMPSLQYAPVWRVGYVEEKFLISRA